MLQCSNAPLEHEKMYKRRYGGRSEDLYKNLQKVNAVEKIPD